MGVTVTMLSLIVLIPLASVFAYALKLSPNEFFTLISKETEEMHLSQVSEALLLQH